MEIQDLKRWHWVLIGLVIGLALSYMWSGTATEPSGRRSSAGEFERDLLMKDGKSGQPLIQGITVGPPIDSVNGQVSVVTYKRLAKSTKSDRYALLDRWFYAEVPYKPAIGGRAQTDANLTIQKYLDQVAAKYDFVGYRMGWWQAPATSMALWTAGSVLLIGGLWPTLLNMLVGAGFGRQPEAREPKLARTKFDWKSFFRRERTGPRSDDGFGQARPQAATAADQQKLREVADQYERTLAEVAASHGAAVGEAAGAPANTEVRKLEGGPLEIAPPMKAEEDDEVEVKGEYYPVLIHHKKKHEEESAGTQEAREQQPTNE